MILYECLCQCNSFCNDQVQHAAKIWIAGKAQLHAGYEIMQGNMTMKDKSYEHEEPWMLHGNISQKGYVIALIGRYGGCFEEDIMRLMMTERIMPRIWMHRRISQRLPREGQRTVPKRLAKYMDGGSAKIRILALVIKNSSTYYRVFAVYSGEHKRSSTLRGVYGGLVILAHPRPIIREGTHLEPHKD